MMSHVEANGRPLLQNREMSKHDAQKQIPLHSAAFYDALSRVFLTRRALKELHRRTKIHRKEQSFHTTQSTQFEFQRHLWTQIQQFARRGGTDLADLRSYAEGTNPTSNVTKTLETGNKASRSSPKSSPYDANFEAILLDHDIFFPDQTSKPENLPEIQQMLLQRRQSLLPCPSSDELFKKFEKAHLNAISQDDIMGEVIQILSGTTAEILSKRNLVFTRLESITGNLTVSAKPDLCDGARRADLHKAVRNDLKKFIVPSDYVEAPVVPNFFLEVKSKHGNPGVARRQACYNGAIGARAMFQLQCYDQEEPVYDGRARTISAIYLDGYLRLYATYLTPPKSCGASHEYHMAEILALALTTSAADFLKGANVYRNARDWAQEQRDALIRRANEKATNISGRRQNHFVPSSDSTTIDLSPNPQIVTSQGQDDSNGNAISDDHFLREEVSPKARDHRHHDNTELPVVPREVTRELRGYEAIEHVARLQKPPSDYGEGWPNEIHG